MAINPNMCVCDQMRFIIWLLVWFPCAASGASHDTEMAQVTHHTLNSLLSLPSALPDSTSRDLSELQRGAGENDRFAKPKRPSVIGWAPQKRQSEDGKSSVATSYSIIENSSYTHLDQQESNHCAEESSSIEYLPSNNTTSEQFRAQMAKDALALKDTLSPSYVALDKTLALMNSRVILPSAGTVRWFSKKNCTDESHHKSLARLHRKCTLTYNKMPEHIRKERETRLFNAFTPLINHGARLLTDKELGILALHRKHISLLVNHIICPPVDGTTEQVRMKDQNNIQLPIFNYSVFDPYAQPQLCACFAVQLLISGFFSHIPDSFFPLLQEISATGRALLVSYMLGPDYVEVFPEFITALYIILSGMSTDAEDPKLLACHHDIVNSLSAGRRWLYGEEHSDQLSHLKQQIDACSPALRALGAGELTDEDPALQTATEKASVYWHALSAYAALTGSASTRNNTVAKKKGGFTIISTVTERAVLTDYFLQCLASPVANTASLSCWVAVFRALTYTMPSIDVYAFMMAHTPPAFAGPLLRCEVVNVTVYVIIASLWLALKMPHSDSILANLDAMHDNPAYRYKAQLLIRLPVSFFARAPPELLRNICSTLFEQIHAYGPVRQTNARLKREAKAHVNDAYHANKRRKCAPQMNTGTVSPKEASQSLPDEDSEDVAHTEVSHTKEARNQKDRASTCQFNLQDEDEQLSSRVTSIGDNGVPLGTLYMNMCIHHKTPDDITEEEIAYLMNNKGTLYNLANICIAVANEMPQRQSLSSINYHNPSLIRVNKTLLEIFGTPTYPTNSACASASGTSNNVCEHCQSGLACAGALEASADGSKKADRTILTPDSPANRASQDGVVPLYDISWDKYANCKHYATILPTFFARQLLSGLVDLISTYSFQNNRVNLFKMAGYILDTNGLAGSMQLLEIALGCIAIDLQKQQQENPEPVNIAAERVNKALPDMPRFVLKSNPAITLSLKDMELRVQRRVGSNFLDARAYMEISDALHRLIFRILSAKNFTQEKFASACEMRYVLMQIVRLLPGECPFVYQASGSAEQAKIKCTWSSFFRAPPSRASPTIIPDNQIVRAINTTCHSSIGALTNNALIEEWLKLFTWLFTRSAVQSLIASQARLQLVHGEGIGRAFAAGITRCIEDMSLLIASIAEDKAKKATNRTPDNSNADQPIQADSDRNRLRLSLKSRLTELISFLKHLKLYK